MCVCAAFQFALPGFHQELMNFQPVIDESCWCPMLFPCELCCGVTVCRSCVFFPSFFHGWRSYVIIWMASVQGDVPKDGGMAPQWNWWHDTSTAAGADCTAVHLHAAIDCMITLWTGGHTGSVCAFATPLMDSSRLGTALYVLTAPKSVKKPSRRPFVFVNVQ